MSQCACAAEFQIALKPARFELSGKAGQRIGLSIDIINQSTAPTIVAVKTNDWSMDDAGRLTYSDALHADSCRPWAVLERANVPVGGLRRQSFRFQVDVPAHTERRECRFMLIFENAESAFTAEMEKQGYRFNFPVSGRIGVAVYLSVNGAKPDMRILRVDADKSAQNTRIFAVTQNIGDAHGRLSGALVARGADGAEFNLEPDGSPLFPGQTRQITLTPRDPRQRASTRSLVLPAQLSGSLEWMFGRLPVETVIGPPAGQ